jgi:hypothetical protein
MEAIMLKKLSNIPALLVGALLLSGPAASQGPAPKRAGLDRIPDRVLKHWHNTSRLVGSPDLTWRREIITVAFSGASDPVYELIERAASEWTSRGGGTRFSFRDAQGRLRTWSTSDTYPASAIRIGFSQAEHDGGYWSAIGTMAEAIPAGEQTMNFGGFDRELAPYYGRSASSEWLQSYDRSTILHEFGHALALSHEHFHPDCQKDLKLEEAVRYLMGPPNNWKENQARFNIEAAYYFRESSGIPGNDRTRRPRSFDISRRIDRASIMLYSFPDTSYYRKGKRSPCLPVDDKGYATSLSDSDIAAFVRYYPVGGRR